ncbi:hypothetical protein HYH03_018071 [Edaphochlamys debaryana]|uniref:O-fucosyltransferase family protein n=1 Tax=Edaphochlamys debaryana TaxID=47281 RepID=A0A836BNP3_9CHLO|nr:hypothetical protein HYH03_018071 [Edaphochlamys debaryana]|eukprot:KAG2483042.1 hypothetical protein HYH03_018071 [Edaphochlamys debaryana]
MFTYPAMLAVALFLTGFFAGVFKDTGSGAGRGGSGPNNVVHPDCAVPLLSPLDSGRHQGVIDVLALPEVEPTWEPAPPTRTLRFAVCNGFANQRLSVVYAALLAYRLGRSLVLPDLIDMGLQREDVTVLASDTNRVAFADMYDVGTFVAAMRAVRMTVLTQAEAGQGPAEAVSLPSLRGNVAAALEERYRDTPHLAVDCPLFKLPNQYLQPQDTLVVWAALNGLRPNRQASETLEALSAAITAFGNAPHPGAAPAAVAAAVKAAARNRGSSPPEEGSLSGYNYIHLRIENDWLAHCKRWEAIADGVVRDNCYSHTETVEQQLASFGFNTSIPLYVASYWDDVDAERKERSLSALRAAGYRLVTSADVLPLLEPLLGARGGGLGAGRGREYRAMLEYFVGMKSTRLIGNSVSTFAALAMLERRHAGRWAAYYNGGNVPLASVLPHLHRLPWVFTYNSWSPGYDYMLKAAVRSAAATRSFQPYCIFNGNSTSYIHEWLVANNVTIIRHEPTWRQALIDAAGRKASENVRHSHLFKTPDMLVSTFQRVDLPVVPTLDQYTYVLYTDADVFFRRPIRLDDFGLPLPKSVLMGYEMERHFPYNAGIILANLPTMRRNYKAFIAAMLDNNNGLYYVGYGPADQGAINMFYEKDLRERVLPSAFNSKPYNSWDPASYIVHFHGPKPHEYSTFLTGGHCDFANLCERAFQESLCRSVREWSRWLPEERLAQQLADLCAAIESPTLKRLKNIIGRRIDD